MCGRFSRYRGQDAIIAAYGVDTTQATPLQSYNIAPTTTVSVIYQENPIILEDMRWGFIPFWAETIGDSHTPINARDDSLHKSMYRYALRKKRCIIPADGFFEWKKFPGKKQPYFITDPEDEFLSFGGIYSVWEDKNRGNTVKSFAIITTSPNDQMTSIHDRMPLILDKNETTTWLDPETQLNQVDRLIKPYKMDLEIYPVSTFVNSPQNNGPRCIKPISEDLVEKEDRQSTLDDFFS